MRKLLRAFFSFTIVISILCSYAMIVHADNNSIYYITANNVRFRSSPQISDSNVLGRFKKGQQLHVIAWEEKWVKVQYEGQVGFVSSDYLQEVIPSDSGAVFPPVAGYTTVGLRLRKGPSTSYDTITIIPQHASLKILGAKDGWLKVIFGKRKGYVSAQYVSIMSTDGELEGIFTTFFSKKQKGRCANIQLAANRMNELVVAPGETFSLLNAIGPVTQADGYQEAPEFKRTSEGTLTVTGYGGGVCQIATTLYQGVLAAMRGNSSLKITEHHHHSKSVGYIADGEDATISWDATKDFQFVNQNDYFIKIVAYVIDGSITCAIVRI